MTLQESYGNYINSQNNYDGVLSYYTDKDLTPYQRLEKSRQRILNNYYDKKNLFELEKEIEEKLQILLEQSLNDILGELNIDIKL